MTKAWVKYNPNPEKRNTTDCQTRALCKFLSISYKEATLMLAQAMFESGYFYNDNANITYLLEQIGATKVVFDRPPTVNQLTKLIDQRVYAMTNGHAVCVSADKYFDSWDSGRRKVISYWTQP